LYLIFIGYIRLRTLLYFLIYSLHALRSYLWAISLSSSAIPISLRPPRDLVYNLYSCVLLVFLYITYMLVFLFTVYILVFLSRNQGSNANAYWINRKSDIYVIR